LLEYTQGQQTVGTPAFRRAFIKNSAFAPLPCGWKKRNASAPKSKRVRSSASLSWRNRDARPWNYMCGVQHSVRVYGTRTGVLPGT